MSGSALEAFTDFVLATGPAFLKGPEDIINEAVKNTYTLPRFWAGKGTQEILQGGSTIKDTIFFEEDSNFTHYHPNEEFTYRNPQFLTEWEIPWRFTMDNLVYTDHEIGLNTASMNRNAKFHKFKTLKRAKEMNLWTGFCNGFEDDMWAFPDQSEMETTTGKKPYSIPCFISENGAAPLDEDAQAWASPDEVQGIDVSANAKWDNQRSTHDAINYTTATNFNGIFAAFSNMFWQLRFDKLPKMPEFSDPTTMPTFIACSIKGIINYEAALRGSQDEFVVAGRQDPNFGAPTFRGVPLQYISNLDTATLYAEDNDTLLSEGATGLDGSSPTGTTSTWGPRYYFINGQYLNLVIHNERYFYKKPPFQPSKQPFTNVMVVDCWHNLVCRSRQRQGILSPDGAGLVNADGTSVSVGY